MDKVYDAFGLEINIGDNVCFTLSMRKDQKPIVKGKITNFIFCEPNDLYGSNRVVYVEVEYVDSPIVEQAKREKKLISKVVSYRVVKCY